MTFKSLMTGFSVSSQLTESDLARAADAGFTLIVCNRPDGEEPDQPTAAAMANAAARLGLGFVHVPVVAGRIADADVARMREALAAAPGPVLAYCRTGTRSATLWALANAGSRPVDQILDAASAAGYDLTHLRSRLLSAGGPSSGPSGRVFDVVVVGGGSGGIATAASLLRRAPSLAVAIIDPATEHFYQPGWTLVGGGVFRPEQTRRPMADVIPGRATWINRAVTAFVPEAKEVVLDDGSTVRYRVLVAAPGIVPDFAAIPGLAETLGRNGVTCNYRFETAPYTYELARSLRGGRALFTQPPMPIKCAGAPQKAMYLSCDIWRKAGTLARTEVEFHLAGAALFGVPDYVPALMEYVNRYGIQLNFGSTLVAVDGARRIATFARQDPDGQMVHYEREFDMLHAVPPHRPPAFVRNSPLADASGFIEVDPATLRHVRYPDIFALGDAINTTNAKTAAAARKQAPIVAVNVLSVLNGQEPAALYDGYGSCPLTVERGRIVLAEFAYGGKLKPTFPEWVLDGRRPTRRAWLLKAALLPPIYWHGMLKGREWLVSPEM